MGGRRIGGGWAGRGVIPTRDGSEALSVSVTNEGFAPPGRSPKNAGKTMQSNCWLDAILPQCGGKTTALGRDLCCLGRGTTSSWRGLLCAICLGRDLCLPVSRSAHL